MFPLALLKSNPRPLGVHQVATPELQLAGDVSEEDAKASSVQLLAELCGEEMDQFTSVWSEIREKFSDEETIGPDFRRVAVAFCWCDADRNRFYRTMEEVWECAKALREKPTTLTTRMYQVANGANAFSGLDDDTKKKSAVRA